MKSLILWFSRFWNLLLCDLEISFFSSFSILKSSISRFWNLLFLDFEIFFFSIFSILKSSIFWSWNLLFFDLEISYFSFFSILKYFDFWNFSIVKSSNFRFSRFWNHQLFYFWIWFLILNYHLFVVNTVFENYSKCRIWIFQFWHFLPIFCLIKPVW